MSNRTLQDNQTYKDLFERLECLLEIVLLALIFYMVWRNGYPHHLFHNFEHRGKYVLMGLYAMILWIILQSPDLAITEAAVGAGVTGLLFLTTIRKVRKLGEGEEKDE